MAKKGFYFLCYCNSPVLQLKRQGTRKTTWETKNNWCKIKIMWVGPTILCFFMQVNGSRGVLLNTSPTCNFSHELKMRNKNFFTAINNFFKRKFINWESFNYTLFPFLISLFYPVLIFFARPGNLVSLRVARGKRSPILSALFNRNCQHLSFPIPHCFYGICIKAATCFLISPERGG